MSKPAEHHDQKARDADFSSAPTKPKGTQGTASNGAAFDGSPKKNGQGTEGTLPPITAVSPAENPPEKPAETEVKRPGFTTHDDWFRIKGHQAGKMRPGLYWHDLTKDGEPFDIWICSAIHATAKTEGERGDSHGLLLRFVTPRGTWREWAAPLHLLKGSGEELRGELLDQGVRIDPKNRSFLNQWIMSRYPRKLIIAATRTGWHGEAFVMPGRTIGNESVRFQSEHAAHDDFVSAGSLTDWRVSVAAPCAGNPVLMLAVSVAFAGPLLKAAKLQEVGGAGVHLVGDSSRGKTTALQAAASVWGAPGYVRTWRATSNGLEATAAALNDTLLVLDEISECDPREIGSIVYALANGTGKQRARRTGGTREAQRWRVVALSSGERTLAAHMAEAGRRAKAGQEARMLDVPATDHQHGAFDYLHQHTDGRAFADAIKQAAGTSYGHAGPAFVEALLNDKRDLPELYARTSGLPGFAAGDGLEARAAGVFSLAGMAGELATEYGITGWLEGAALDAATRAYKAWRDHRGGGQTEDRQILQAVQDFIARHGDARYSSIHKGSKIPVRERAGYWRDDNSGRIYLTNSPALREAATGYDLRRILDALEDAGWIIDHDEGKRSKKVKIAGVPINLYAIRPTTEGES